MRSDDGTGAGDGDGGGGGGDPLSRAHRLEVCGCLCVLIGFWGCTFSYVMTHKQQQHTHTLIADPRDRGPQGRASPQHPDFGRGHSGGGAGGGDRVAVSHWREEGGKAGVWVGGLFGKTKEVGGSKKECIHTHEPSIYYVEYLSCHETTHEPSILL